jgi:hypothetical protein
MPSRLSADRLLPRAALALALLALIAAPGCVRRRLLVRSNPPGAMVYVDNQPIGTTPCATSFTYYGTREIKLVKPGYETLRVVQPIPPPWYQIPPIDFVAENAVPADINDYRTVTYTMSPQIIKPTDHLMAEAEQLRTATQQGAVVPAAASASPLLPAVPPSAPAPLGPPTITSPAVGLPPSGPTLAPPTWSPEAVSPGLIVPPTPGAGVLPPGGRALEPLPAPQ